MAIASLLSAFVESPIRRLLFPYLEPYADGDDGDDDQKIHWMSHVAHQALGRDRPSVTTAQSPRPGSQSPAGSDRTGRSSRPSSSTSAMPLRCTTQSDDLDTPWLGMYQPSYESDSCDDGAEDDPADAQGYHHASSSTARARSATLAAAPEKTPRGADRPSRPRHGLVRARTSDGSLGSHVPQRRRLRQRSAPQPLKPAQPLPHVNTALPLHLPPLELRAAVPCTESNAGEESPVISESDGSFHGDAGDADPEAQMAAGIIALRNAGRRSSSAAKAASSPRASSPSAPSSTPTSNEQDLDARQLQECCGTFLPTVAKLFFEFTLPSVDRGALKAASVAALSNQAPTGLAEHSHSRHVPGGTSTPSSLRAEVNSWSRARRQTMPQSGLNPRRAGQPKAVSSSSTPNQLLGSWPLPEVMRRSASLQDFTDLVGAGDTTPYEWPQRQSDAGSEDGADDDDDEAAAYSSLWASPVTSRSSSHYNLRILSDEPSAFEQHDDSRATASSLARTYRLQQLRLQMSKLTENDGSHVCRPAPAKSAVSPLWDMARIQDDLSPAEETSRDGSTGGLGEGRLPYARSWTSLLGVGV
ncbi:unnamed protein product [Parajaminaea phylloscopi]